MRKIFKFSNFAIILSFSVILILLLCGTFFWTQYWDTSYSTRELATSIVDGCKEVEAGKTNELCYVRLFDILSKEYDIQKVLAVLNEVQTIDKSTNFCHLISHKIAQNEVTKRPQEWLQILKELDPVSCNSGFFHGTIEGLMSVNPEFTLDHNTILNTCQAAKNLVTKDLQEFYLMNCVHTIAHILLVQEEGRVNESLYICSQLEEELKPVCYFGVFMEHDQRQNLAIHGLGSRDQLGFDTFEGYTDFCNSYQNKQQVACWKSLGWVFHNLSEFNPDEVYEKCRQAKQDEAFIQCYHRALGVMVSVSETKGFAEVKIIDFCAKIQDEKLYRNCSMLFVEYILRVTEKLDDLALNYCALIKEDLKSECVQFVREYIQIRAVRRQALSAEADYAVSVIKDN